MNYFIQQTPENFYQLFIEQTLPVILMGETWSADFRHSIKISIYIMKNHINIPRPWETYLPVGTFRNELSFATNPWLAQLIIRPVPHFGENASVFYVLNEHLCSMHCTLLSAPSPMEETVTPL